MPARSVDTLRWNIRRTETGVNVELRGMVDESSPFDELSQQLSGAVVLDAEGITRVNSQGVRGWIGFLRTLRATSLSLVRCSPAVVAQLNAVHNFASQAVVRSVMAPFYCAGCDEEHLHLVPIPATHLTPRQILDPIRVSCPNCGGALELDDLPERYFLFLSH